MVLDIHRAYFYVFCLSAVGLLVAPAMVKPTDELCLLLFSLLAAADMAFNRNFRKYRLMFVLLGVMAFYLAYSLAMSPYNTPRAQMNDFLMQLKPLVAFSVTYAIAPKFTANEKAVVKVLSVVLAAVSFIVLEAGFIKPVLFHVYYQGMLCIGCAMAYLLMSYDERLPRGYSAKDLAWATVILVLGMACTRSKYYGFMVVALYLLYVYRPGTVNLKRPRNAAILTVAIVGLLAVSWGKISYYFITGNSDTFDPDMIQSYARPVLFANSAIVLSDYPALGSGLASYATFSSSSSVNYSTLYHEYGLSKVWGMSPGNDDFIADTFYPELAQFGIAGVFFFVYFCWWIWRKFRIVLRVKTYPLFAIGVMGFAFLAIDGVAGCSVLQAPGEFVMAVMGIVAASAKVVPKPEVKGLLARPPQSFVENGKNEKI